MTIRFLTSWNGYQPGDVATLANEATLISAGIARLSNVTDGPVTGRSFSRTTWAALPSASVGNRGTVIWVDDFPGPQGYGVLCMSTGTRWRPVSQQHCLMNYHNGETGLVVAAGAAEALYGVARLIKGGMLKPGDRFRLSVEIKQAAASDSGTRTVRFRSATTEAGLLAGAQAGVFTSNNTLNVAHSVDKSSIVVTDTAGISGTAGAVGSSTTPLALQTLVFSDLTADGYMQFSVQNASSQALTIYSSALFVEFGS